MKKSYILALFASWQWSAYTRLIHMRQSKFEKGSIIMNPGVGLGYWYGRVVMRFRSRH